MSTTNPTADGSFGTFDEPRTIRALTECMQVVRQADDLFTVFSGSGSEYTVDLRGRPTCDCPDFSRRDDVTACKHIRRAYVATGRVAIPAALRVEAMDDLLVRRVEAGDARVAATDGGLRVERDRERSQEATSDASECVEGDDACPGPNPADGELPCFECYQAGR